ncbi:hypothetical protein ACWENQ_43535 [Nonomuraea sp. NPDC004354]
MVKLTRPRLIATTRTLVELLDNCADALTSELAATVVLVAIIGLQVVADLLENLPDAHVEVI